MEEMFTFLGMGSSSHENYFLNEDMLEPFMLEPCHFTKNVDF